MNDVQSFEYYDAMFDCPGEAEAMFNRAIANAKLNRDRAMFTGGG